MCLFFEVLTFQSLLWGAKGLLLGYAKAAACRVMQRGLLEESDVVLCGERVFGHASEQAFGYDWDPATCGGCGGVNNVIASSVIM